MAGDPLVAIRGLAVDARTPAGPAHLLRGVDLEIGRGRIVGIVGESGSGKSTLASALLGLMAGNVESPRGDVVFDGVDLLALPPDEMAAWRGNRIAMIFQDPMTSLNPLFTVGTHLADVLARRFPGLGRDEIRRRSAGVLAEVGISDPVARLSSYPHQLSGGMRQRVVIAMALLVRPDLLIADEPTTALDATVEAQIVALFAELKSELSGSVLFISHHLGLVAEFCDDLCVMYGGLVVERGPVDLVLSRPRHPYTRALLDCEIEDGSQGRLTTIPGEVPDALQEVEGCIFASRCAYVLDACRAAAPPMSGFGENQAAACIRSLEVLP